MEKFIEYAPVILVVLGFLYAYKVFVTPSQLEAVIKDLRADMDKKFVHKEAHDIIIAEMKEDISDMKEKINKIYDKIMGLNQ